MCPFCGCHAWQLISWYSGRTHSNDKIHAMVFISVLCVAKLKVKFVGFPYFRKNVITSNFKG